MARRKRPPAEPIKPSGPRVNDQIRISPIRLIGDQGEQLGVVELGEAMMIARDRGMDLVEVSPKTRPVVCKLMDYGRYKYEQKKKVQEAKKKERRIEIKTLRFRPNIEEHDLETKAKQIYKFLIEGNKVKIDVTFRRREMRQAHSGTYILDQLEAKFADVAKVESKDGKLNQRVMSMLLAPDEKRIKEILREEKRNRENAASEITTAEASPDSVAAVTAEPSAPPSPEAGESVES